MKRLFVYLFCAFTVSSLFAQAVSRKEKEEALANNVAKVVESQQYEIRINSATPSSGRYVNLSGSYSLKISGDSVYSYLPYYGTAYVAPMGDDRGLIFNMPLQNYKVEKKKGMYEVTFSVKTPQDNYRYRLSISESGYTSVYVLPNNRSNISFWGEIELPHDK